MRCHFMSDLHLEAQEFPHTLPEGDILIVAGDLCNACAFEAKPADLYMERQRDRVRRFADAAVKRFLNVLMVAGNHEHYGGVYEDTVPLLRKHLPGFTVLDDGVCEIGGVRFFGATLWSDFEGRDGAAIARCRRGVGEYFFVRTRAQPDGTPGGPLAKLRPEDTLAAHDRSLRALEKAVEAAGSAPLVVITHHAPSFEGLNPRFKGKGLDGAYASRLDARVAALPNCPLWVHGHTHIRHRYRIGATDVRVNCRGVEAPAPQGGSFRADAWVEL